MALGGGDAGKAFEGWIAALKAFRTRTDLVGISGDLADTPTADEYEHLKRLLSRLDLRLVSIPGNHDSRELMRAAFPHATYAFSSGPLNQSVEIAGLALWLPHFTGHAQTPGRLRGPTPPSSSANRLSPP